MRYAVFNGFLFDKDTISENEQLAMTKLLEKYGHLGELPKDQNGSKVKKLVPIDYLHHLLKKRTAWSDEDILKVADEIMQIFRDRFIPALMDGLLDEEE